MLRGFAKEESDKVTLNCKLLKDHLNVKRSAVLPFSSNDAFKRNFPQVLRQRLYQLDREFAPVLFQAIENAINNLNDPTMAMGQLTPIRDQALRLIWKNENISTEGKIDDQITGTWEKTKNFKKDKFFTKLADEHWLFPTNREGDQVALLRYLTGAKEGVVRIAKKTSKSTYVLMNSIHEYRNYREHSLGEEMTFSVATLALATSVELLACLQKNSGNHVDGLS